MRNDTRIETMSGTEWAHCFNEADRLTSECDAKQLRQCNTAMKPQAPSMHITLTSRDNPSLLSDNPQARRDSLVECVAQLSDGQFLYCVMDGRSRLVRDCGNRHYTQQRIAALRLMLSIRADQMACRAWAKANPESHAFNLAERNASEVGDELAARTVAQSWLDDNVGTIGRNSYRVDNSGNLVHVAR